MALLIIGASISFQEIRHRMKWVLSASLIKLFLMPGLGYVAYRALGFPPGEYLPGLILLASPTATIAYRITSYNVCYTKLLRFFHTATFSQKV